MRMAWDGFTKFFKKDYFKSPFKNNKTSDEPDIKKRNWKKEEEVRNRKREKKKSMKKNSQNHNHQEQSQEKWDYDLLKKVKLIKKYLSNFIWVILHRRLDLKLDH